MRILLLLSLIALAGCSTAAQRKAQAISTGNTEIETQLKACLTAAYNDPANGPIRPHEPMLPGDATLIQLADTSTVTPSEVAAINTIHPMIAACRKAELEALIHTIPGYVPILTHFYSQQDDDTILLMQRKLSWGDFSKRRRDRAAAVIAALQSETQRVAANLQQENDAELSRRQAAAAAFAQWAQTQQMINTMNRPVMTTCTATPGMANCISH